MNRRGVSHLKTAALAAAVALGALGGWGLWRARAGAPASAGGGARFAGPALLATLPRGTGSAATDREIERWTERTRTRPGDAEAWVNLGDALMQKARETLDPTYTAHAERVYQKALALRPEHGGARAGMAWVCGARHEFEQSIVWARRALAADAKNQEAYALLGDAAIEMGDYDAAFQHYQKMLDLRPNLASYSRGAHLLFLTGDWRKATWLMGKAIEAGGPYSENTAWCRAQLALMLWNTGALPAAEQMLKAALQQSPKNPHLLAALGRVKASRKDYDGAIDAYRRAIAVVPQVESLVALGDLYRLTGRNAEAEKQFAMVEAVHRLNRANGVRGDVQIALFWAAHDRNLAEAVQLAEAEFQNRRGVYAADALAWCYYKSGRLREAHEMIQRALRLHTPEARFYFHSGMIHARLGERATAQNHLYQALSLNPNFSPVDARVATETLRRLGATPIAAAPQPAGRG